MPLTSVYMTFPISPRQDTLMKEGGRRQEPHTYAQGSLLGGTRNSARCSANPSYDQRLPPLHILPGPPGCDGREGACTVVVD